MRLKEQISKDYINALKTKNTLVKNLLSVVKGEIQTIEKNKGVESLSDDEVINILNRTSKSLKEMSFVLEKSGKIKELETNKQELLAINLYLPKSMSKEEIISKVTEVINSGVTNIGGIMKSFSELIADRKVVSEVIKELLP
jgi:uncharacterized protein YqeY